MSCLFYVSSIYIYMYIVVVSAAVVVRMLFFFLFKADAWGPRGFVYPCRGFHVGVFTACKLALLTPGVATCSGFQKIFCRFRVACCRACMRVHGREHIHVVTRRVPRFVPLW